MEKVAKILLAILGFAGPIVFVLYLIIPSMRPENSEDAFGIGFILFIIAAVGIIILCGIAGYLKDKE